MKSNPELTVHEDVGSRVITFGFGLDHETLTGGDAAGEPNPCRDARVREAAYRAIEADALVAGIMRGSAETASQLVSGGTRGYSEADAERLGHDPDVKTAQDETAYVPPYVQPPVAASKASAEVVQRPDDFLIVRRIEVGDRARAPPAAADGAPGLTARAAAPCRRRG